MCAWSFPLCLNLLCHSDSSHTGLLLPLRSLGSDVPFLNSSTGFSVEGHGETWEHSFLYRVWASPAASLTSLAMSFYKASGPQLFVESHEGTDGPSVSLPSLSFTLYRCTHTSVSPHVPGLL